MVITFSSSAVDFSPLRRSSRTCLRARRYFLLKHQANVAENRLLAGLSAILIASRSCSKIADVKTFECFIYPVQQPKQRA